MAHGSTKNISMKIDKNAKWWWATIKNIKKDDETSYIEVTEADNRENVDTSSNYIEGNLHFIKIGIGDYEGNEYPTVALYLLDDDNNVYQLSCNFKRLTIMMRGILLKLLTLDNYNNIRISVHGNKDDFKNFSMKHNDEKVEHYFLTKDEQIAFITLYEKGGKEYKDYFKLDQEVIRLVEENIIPKLSGYREPNEEKPIQSSSSSNNNTEQQEAAPEEEVHFEPKKNKPAPF